MPSRDPRGARRAGDVAALFGEDALDVAPLELLHDACARLNQREAQREHVFIGIRARRDRWRLRLDLLLEIAARRLKIAKRDPTRHEVSQLAHIARPRVAL